MRGNVVELTGQRNIPQCVRITLVAIYRSDSRAGLNARWQHALPGDEGVIDRVIEDVFRLESIQRFLRAIKSGVSHLQSLFARQANEHRSFCSCEIYLRDIFRMP